MCKLYADERRLLKLVENMKKHRFLFEELVKRDFKKKYKRTVLGMGWSMLSPLLTLLVMKIVFEQLFGRMTPHYTMYLFCGLLFFNWFAESTNAGMRCLYSNAAIFSKVNVPKYLFLFASNVQTLINFALTLIIFFIFCFLDDISFSWKFPLIVYPVITLLVFNIGVGMILSALFIFFRDMDYLWKVFTQLLMYGSAIFYDIGNLSPKLQAAFWLNPVFRHIAYVRELVINGEIPSLSSHLVLAGSAVAAFLIGSFMYKRYNTRFLYYV